MSDEIARRADVARDVLDGLDEGYHYAVLQWADVDGTREVVEVAWNHERDPEAGSRNDDFSDREQSERHRSLAVEHQEQFESDDGGTETEQMKLVTDGGQAESFRWECVCGWSIERDKRAANLPEENNERIAQAVAEVHEDRPRFGDKASETHAVSTTDMNRSGGDTQ